MTSLPKRQDVLLRLFERAPVLVAHGGRTKDFEAIRRVLGGPTWVTYTWWRLDQVDYWWRRTERRLDRALRCCLASSKVRDGRVQAEIERIAKALAEAADPATTRRPDWTTIRQAVERPQ